MIRVACVVMQRNEASCLSPWLAWHGHLFGPENLFVIDHGSDHAGVRATLALAEARGGKVLRLPASTDFRIKGEIVSTVLAQLDATGAYDFLLPLDCDEFLVMREATGSPCCGKRKILDYLHTLAGEPAPLLVQENFLNVLGHPHGFWPCPYEKVFFTRGHAGVVDPGSHRCISRPDPPVPTRLVYAHFHHKPYATQLAMSREKLRRYVDIDDRAALAAYRGTGWHLVENLLKTETDYNAMMTGGSLQFPELGEAFEALGINPAFCETS